MIKLLTGYTGVNIFAPDDQDLYKGIIGNTNVVFNDVGNGLALDVAAENTTVSATVASGAFSFNGRIVRVTNDETINLVSVESGRYRKCVIVARYSVNNSDQKESVTLMALCSSDHAGTKVLANELTVDTVDANYIDGSTTADFPLYSFLYSSNGIENDTLKTLFDTVKNLKQLTKGLSQEVSDRIDAVYSAVSEEAAARAEAISNAIATEVSDRNIKITSEINSAIQTEVYQRNAVIDDEIADEVSARNRAIQNAVNTEKQERIAAINNVYSHYKTIIREFKNSVNVTGPVTTNGITITFSGRIIAAQFEFQNGNNNYTEIISGYVNSYPNNVRTRTIVIEDGNVTVSTGLTSSTTIPKFKIKRIKFETSVETTETYGVAETTTTIKVSDIDNSSPNDLRLFRVFYIGEEN